jgi:hypothetical protein
MRETPKGFSVLSRAELLETGHRRVTFGQAAKVGKNCLLPMASSSGLQASNDAKCFHGHRDSGSPGVRGKPAQPGICRICKSDPAFPRRATSYLHGSPEKRPSRSTSTRYSDFQTTYVRTRSPAIHVPGAWNLISFWERLYRTFHQKICSLRPESTDPIQQA